MNRLTIAALVLLAGCAQTPQMVMDEGRQSEHRLSKSPTDAAGCVARNAENYRPNALHVGFRSSVRAAPEGMEIMIQLASSTSPTLAVIRVSTADTGGSRAKVWSTRDIRADTLAAFLAGC